MKCTEVPKTTVLYYLKWYVHKSKSFVFFFNPRVKFGATNKDTNRINWYQTVTHVAIDHFHKKKTDIVMSNVSHKVRILHLL